jgi:hypothetical protein
MLAMPWSAMGMLAMFTTRSPFLHQGLAFPQDVLDVGHGVVGAHGLVVILGAHAPDQVEHVEDAFVAGEGEDVALGRMLLILKAV